MEMNQNQTFSHGAYSNLAPHIFLSKFIKVFQCFYENQNLTVLWLNLA